ncbi:MAG TPA: plastocyanin/azurin family copper-binding protein [Gemmatimonadaceae bacterium]|nr:plastocyanin/azurin family copper-binding protein [Gemmatimonadaceae bacterium]
MKRWNFAAALMAAAVLAGCGGAGGSGDSTGPTTTPPVTGGPPPTTSNTNQVTMTSSQTFSPGTVNVPKGTTVTWTWPACDDTGYGGYASCVTHSVVFDDGSNISSPEQSAGTFTRTFATAGTFKYHCGVHGTAMNGQVVVQ